MISGAHVDRIELNGQPAQVEDLRVLVQTNYGHFTAMQVRSCGVRGLDLHLQRLDLATRELFGTSLDPERVRGYLRQIIGTDTQPMSLRINVFSRMLDRDRLDRAVPVDVLVTRGAAREASNTPMRLKSFVCARHMPAIKHVGTFALFHYRRLAQQAGFDDALFVDESGRISEGSIWNIGFADAQRVVWPDAPQLNGVSMQLLQAGLRRLGTPSATRPIYLDELATLRCAFFTNASTPIRPIASIDAITFELDDEFNERLLRAYESNAWELP